MSWRTISFGAGMSFRMGEELSFGFREEARRLVDELVEHKTHRAKYERFKGLENDDKLFDGLPLMDPRTTTPFFPTDRIITKSTNRDFYVGVFIPIDVAKAVSGMMGD